MLSNSKDAARAYTAKIAAPRYNASMPKVSAGLLMYRIRQGALQVLLVHPGGPIWRNKDEGAWSIPKGEVESGEDLLAAAKREFEEEVGLNAKGQFIKLNPITQKNGKTVHAWAFEGDYDPRTTKSNTFKTEWPPKSGRLVEFPEVDRAEFFDLEMAKKKVNPAQVALLDELESVHGPPACQC
jgi:predicted NUDIX family NTP pyrophosphohydrolase